MPFTNEMIMEFEYHVSDRMPRRAMILAAMIPIRIPGTQMTGSIGT